MIEPQHKGRAIVLPATFPGCTEMSHCTVRYLGTAETMEGTQDQVMQGLYVMRRMFGGPTIFAASGTDWFGVDRDIPVMRINSHWLEGFHRITNRILAEEGVTPQESTWEYKPHVTLPTADIELPEIITLHRPVLWWEDERPVSVPWLNDV